MKTLMIVITFAICYIPVLLIMGLTPYLTRKTESFGVTIPENIYYDPQVKKIRDGYKKNALVFGGIIAVAVLLVALNQNENIGALVLTGGMFVEIALMLCLYAVGHKKMKELKEKSNWMPNRPQRVVLDTEFRKKRVRVSPLWFLLYFAAIVLTVGIGLYMYDIMPDKVPMQYNMNGEVTRWADKSYKLLLFAPLMQVFITVLMAFVYWTIGKAKQQVDVAQPMRSIEQNRIFRYRWSAFTVFSGLAVIMLFGFMQISILGVVKSPWLIISIPMVISLVIVISSIILSITTGQGGSRISVESNEFNNVVNRDDDKHWKFGIFYYNPDDPALFVEKRFGIGWTNNFARPLSWVMIIGLVIILILISYAAKFLAG